MTKSKPKKKKKKERKRTKRKSRCYKIDEKLMEINFFKVIEVKFPRDEILLVI